MFLRSIAKVLVFVLFLFLKKIKRLNVAVQNLDYFHWLVSLEKKTTKIKIKLFYFRCCSYSQRIKEICRLWSRKTQKRREKRGRQGEKWEEVEKNNSYQGCVSLRVATKSHIKGKGARSGELKTRKKGITPHLLIRAFLNPSLGISDGCEAAETKACEARGAAKTLEEEGQ